MPNAVYYLLHCLLPVLFTLLFSFSFLHTRVCGSANHVCLALRPLMSRTVPESLPQITNGVDTKLIVITLEAHVRDTNETHKCFEIEAVRGQKSAAQHISHFKLFKGLTSVSIS